MRVTAPLLLPLLLSVKTQSDGGGSETNKDKTQAGIRQIDPDGEGFPGNAGTTNLTSAPYAVNRRRRRAREETHTEGSFDLNQKIPYSRLHVSHRLIAFNAIFLHKCLFEAVS